MTTYFIVANSFAAPFCSDQSFHYHDGETAEDALMEFAVNYKHPAGLYCAVAFASADSYHRNENPLAQYHSNRLAQELKAKEGKGAYTYCGHSAEHFELDGEHFYVKNPKGGSIAAPTAPAGA